MPRCRDLAIFMVTTTTMTTDRQTAYLTPAHARGIIIWEGLGSENEVIHTHTHTVSHIHTFAIMSLFLDQKQYCHTQHTLASLDMRLSMHLGVLS